MVIIILLYSPEYIFCQNSDIQTINIKQNSDCSTALSVSTTSILGPTNAPEGYGKIHEIKDNPKTGSIYFEKENNSVWYKFKALYTANLVFDIVPLKESDDYDFLLYKSSTENFYSDLIQKRINPVRSNIARSQGKNKGKTGLSWNATEEFVVAGPNNTYSKSVKVIKGEIYYLILDNVYPNGDGHYIIFDYLNDKGVSLNPKIIKGKVLDNNSGAILNAEISFSKSATNEQEISVSTNPITGEFAIVLNSDIDFFAEYTLNIKSKGYFFYQTSIIPYSVINSKEVLTIKLEKLIKDEKYSITKIYFYPNSPQFIPSSEPVLKELLNMMNENPNMQIEIHGHIDGCQGDAFIIQKLSESRAYNIRKFLIDNGIHENRLNYKGFGCSKMVFSNPQNEEERQVNRRVEILILKI